MSLTFNRAGDRLAAGLTDGVAWIWDTSRVDAIVPHARLRAAVQGVYGLTFDASGDYLFGAGPRGIVSFWILNEELAQAAIRSIVGDQVTREEWSTFMPGLAYSSVF